jgi:hypothetical protein
MADSRVDPALGRDVDFSESGSRRMVEGELGREELAAEELEPDGPEAEAEREAGRDDERDDVEEARGEAAEQEVERDERTADEVAREERRLDRDRARQDRDPDAAARRVERLDEELEDRRAEAAGERRVGREDDARAVGLDYRAAGRDDPRADYDRVKADRLRASAAHQDRIADYDDSAADELAAEARQESRTTAGPRPDDGTQPPAAEAVRTRPRSVPRARRNLSTQVPQREVERRRGG